MAGATSTSGNTEGIYDGTRRLGAVGKTAFGEWCAQDAGSEQLGYHQTHAEACKAVFDADKAKRTIAKVGGAP